MGGSVIRQDFDRHRFTPYEILGAGGMGIVHRVRDTTIDSVLALKTLRSIQPDHLYAIKREFRLLAGLRHPNLVRLYELFASPVGNAYFTMEFVPGDDLVARARGDISPGASLPASATNACRGLFRQLVEGLLHVHAAGRLHRDLKPSNVLVTPSGRVVLLDFGLATSIRPEAQRGDGVGGSGGFMAPEVLWGAPASMATDLYAVGLMLHLALMGSPAFEGSGLPLLQAKEAGLSSRRPGGEHLGPLFQLTRELLSPKPSSRPCGDEVLRALKAAVTPTPRRVVSGFSAPFVGRTQELAALRSALTATEAGSARVVGVRGKSGLGKSELARRFLAASDASYSLSGRCHLQESIPYKALDGLMDGLSRDLASANPLEPTEAERSGADALVTLFPVLRRVPGLTSNSQEAGAGDLEGIRRSAVRAWRSLLGRVAANRSILLWIDDLQWGDKDSVDLLRMLIADPGSLRLLVILGWRSEEEERSEALAALKGLKETLGNEAMQVLEIGPLDRAACTRLAAHWIGCDERDAEPRRLADEASGSPLFVGELARYLTAGQSATRSRLDTGTPATTLRGVVVSRVAGLSAEDRAIVRLVSASGQPVELPVVLRAAGVARSWRLGLPALRDACILRSTFDDGVEFLAAYHDQVREAIAGEFGAEERRSLHRALADSLEQEQTPEPGRLAEHLVEAGESRRAVTYAIAAATQARAALAYNRAAKMYGLAIRLKGGDSSAWELVRLQAHAFAHAGRGREAATAYEAAASALSSRPKPATTRRLEILGLRRNAAEQWLRAGASTQGVETLKRVLSAAHVRYPKSAVEAVGAILSNRALVRLRGGFRFRARVEAQVDPRLLEQIDACWAATLGLNLHDLLRSFYFQSRHSVLALRAGEPLRVIRALTVEAVFMSGEGHSRARARSLDLLRHADRLARQTGDHPDSRAFIDLCAGIGSVFSGRWKEGLRRLAASERRYNAQRDGVVWETLNCQMYRTWAQWFAGDLRGLQAEVPTLLRAARARGDVMAEAGLGTGHANAAWLVSDEPERALLHTSRAVGLFAPTPECPCQAPHLFHLIAAVNAELYMGRGWEAFQRFAEAWPSMRAGGFMRMQCARAELLDLRGRCAVAAAADPRPPPARFKSWTLRHLLRRASSDAKRLEREDIGYVQGLGKAIAVARSCLVEPGVAIRAIASLANELEHTLPLHAAAAASLIKPATNSACALSRLGVRNPLRFARMLLPGTPIDSSAATVRVP